MDITTRNFFRLLRAGAFGQQDMVEPMSASKWRKTMMLSVAHGVEAEAFEGQEVLRNQFFMQAIPEALRVEWADLAFDTGRKREAKEPQLSPRLAKRLASIAEKGNASSVEYRLLEEMTRLAYALLTDDYWVRQLLILGELIREKGPQADRVQLQGWLKRMKMTRMARLEGALLIELMGVQPEEVPVSVNPSEFNIEKIATAVPHGQDQLRFSQGKNIFVHTSNTSAIVWNARRSARFFRYCPPSSITQLFSSFARSLTNIEE